MVKQIDTHFRVRYSVRGAHTHCALFAAPHSNATYAKCGDFTLRNEEFVALTIAFNGAEFIEKRDPDPTKQGIFTDHRCWMCQDGNLKCAQGNPRNCEYPRARND